MGDPASITVQYIHCHGIASHLETLKVFFFSILPWLNMACFLNAFFAPFFLEIISIFEMKKKSSLYLSISCFHNLLVVHSHVETICPLYLPVSSLSMYPDITIVIGVVIFFFPIYPVSIFRPDLLYIITI